eukprot:CAMPEP_0169134486 /NCGR_PEP_ID=MMETSP1015-20121227/39905_1 /TAXON_ID=342587 /ORGANISM="Karlodinium micrum, Strain CCMP2283" /LENGTH=58 /DNA_ID=CAMNT_0009199015 /DNA_START=80 /DNA_END=252 /DNA_ORIENTATION=+
MALINLSLIMLASLVTSSIANDFLKGAPKLPNEHISEEEIRTSILEEVEGTFGAGTVS